MFFFFLHSNFLIAVLDQSVTPTVLRLQLREQSIPRLGRRSKAYYGARLERELLSAFDACPERRFICLNDQKEVEKKKKRFTAGEKVSWKSEQ